jgi:hypothetical protein
VGHFRCLFSLEQVIQLNLLPYWRRQASGASDLRLKIGYYRLVEYHNLFDYIVLNFSFLMQWVFAYSTCLGLIYCYSGI